jgi:hypothetical protein
MGMIHQFTDNQTGAVITISRSDNRTKECLLRVTRKNKVIGERKTFVTWEPIFGSDVADVHEWEKLATEIIDGHIQVDN